MSHTNSTTNYGLPEFLSSDKPAWMADINTAFATIDTQMKANADSASQANTDIGTMGLNMAPGYSNASTYSVGDIVMYNKRVYICDIAVTVPEEFDSAKWSYYRMSDIGETANEDHELIGNTDISSVGDGTLTGAVSTLNANLSNLGDFSNGTWTITTLPSSSATSICSITLDAGTYIIDAVMPYIENSALIEMYDNTNGVILGAINTGGSSTPYGTMSRIVTLYSTTNIRLRVGGGSYGANVMPSSVDNPGIHAIRIK